MLQYPFPQIKMSLKYYFFENKICESSKVFLNPHDLGFLRGYGVFDFLRTFKGKPFLLREHLRRFQNSAKLLNLPFPSNQKWLKNIVLKLLRKNRLPEATVRLILTGGIGKDSMTPDNKPQLLIFVEPLHPFPQTYYQKGIKLITLEHLRENPRAKTLNYSFALQHKPALKRAGAQEMLYLHQGSVLECSTSNFFMFKGNKLITPRENILLGTTRNLVLKLAQNHFKIQEKKIHLAEIPQADEIFITATLKEVLPVVKINHWKIGQGKPAGKTQIINNLFQKYIQRVHCN